MTADLVAFLRQRLDEDERIAKSIDPTDWVQADWAEVDMDLAYLARTFTWPARVLADVQAKRTILDHEDMWGEDSAILRILAQPYADHADFDPAWRIDTAGHV